MDSAAKPLVVVTGASGFLGYQIVYQLLQSGYRVRGTARGGKAALLRNALGNPDFEVAEIQDISWGDLSYVLQGAEAVIHTAIPVMIEFTDREMNWRNAVEASLHIFREVKRGRVPKVVMTNSMVSFPPGGPYGREDWNAMSREAALAGPRWHAYSYERTLVDQAILAFAKQEPAIDLTLMYPSWIFGPLAPGYEDLITTQESVQKLLSTNGFISSLLRSEYNLFPPSRGFVDVRDAASAHIKALTTPGSNGQRLPIVAPELTDYGAAVRWIEDACPHLRGAVVDPHIIPASLDRPAYERGWPGAAARDVLGMTEASYTKWRTTVMDTVQSLLALQVFCQKLGYDLPSGVECNNSVFGTDG